MSTISNLLREFRHAEDLQEQVELLADCIDALRQCCEAQQALLGHLVMRHEGLHGTTTAQERAPYGD